jgi:hypothetical protein
MYIKFLDGSEARVGSVTVQRSPLLAGLYAQDPKEAVPMPFPKHAFEKWNSNNPKACGSDVVALLSAAEVRHLQAGIGRARRFHGWSLRLGSLLSGHCLLTFILSVTISSVELLWVYCLPCQQSACCDAHMR